jgi:hypothetical protein
VLYRWCYTLPVPTSRARHTFTETPPVERALHRLRSIDPSARIDFKELVILGAQAKTAQLERAGAGGADRRRALVDEFLALRADDRLDAGAGLALHESGWTRAE